MNLLAASRNPFVSLYTSLVSILCGICMWMFPRHCADDVSNISYTLKHYAGQPALFLQSFFPPLTLRSPDFIGKITDSFMIAPYNNDRDHPLWTSWWNTCTMTEFLKLLFSNIMDFIRLQLFHRDVYMWHGCLSSGIFNKKKIKV